ncbi:ribonuclease R [Taibaiella sp. KBW10]|uniref:ribonuclease R n=1 Tax=Taibaiella sp. KBW10 TaxID=2153357 RepID=UPI000F5AC41E|nr:ribonuclease R [Taibaiella sp. KBW10]RQO31300.1 ribonuclease R [Taibaiella sp. KBW10]
MTKKKQSQYIPKTQKKSALSGRSATGKLEIVKSGMGFVIVEGWDKDILIKSNDMKTAIDGDIVKVLVERVSSSGRPEGKVTEVVKRMQNEFTGILEVSENFGFLIPDKNNINFDIFIPSKFLKGGKTGDKAIARISDWNGANKNPQGEVVELLSAERDNQVAMKEILLNAGFQLRFSDEAMKESDALPETLPEAEIAKRKDCRDILTITIDPADAKDFDDAISFRTLKNGLYELGVHIADVSHYVQPDTELDKEAYERATSVYLPDRVLPMLPEHISNVLCSLRPNEDKFTFSAIFQINEEGEVKQYWIGRTVTHSDRRFSYEEAQEIIETGVGDYAEEVLTMHRIAQNLRKERFEKGAINFSSQEIRFKLDEEGVPIGIMVKESKDANKLIEEFMLLANRTVAAYVGKRKVNNAEIPFPYRIHDLPNEDKLANFAQFSARFGYKLNLNTPDTIASSFNQMLKDVAGKPEQHILEQLGIRTMSKAVYATENIGHYGLGFEDYCHFTSPIRRYPDVMVHRIVQQVIDNEVKIDKKMDAKCTHCSERERKAMEAERLADKYKQVEFMSKHIGETFEALISGVATMGFWAETIAHKCEGMISIADLSSLDEFVFVEADYALVGSHTGMRFRIGDKVQIQVVRADLEKKQIDFDFVPEDQVGNAIPVKKAAAALKETVVKKKNTSSEKKGANPAKKSTSSPKKSTGTSRKKDN